MKSWELSLGLYPGILLGIRTYQGENLTEHVLYLPIFEVCLAIYHEE